MLGNLCISCVTTMVCVMIQCGMTVVLLQVLEWLQRKGFLQPTAWRSAAALTLILLVSLAGTLLQIGIWAGVFWCLGAFGDFESCYYHSAVNFTTLGYGDLILPPERRILGPMEAANGVLMFGLTTSVLFAVMQGMVRRGQAHRREQTQHSSGFFEP